MQVELLQQELRSREARVRELTAHVKSHESRAATLENSLWTLQEAAERQAQEGAAALAELQQDKHQLEGHVGVLQSQVADTEDRAIASQQQVQMLEADLVRAQDELQAALLQLQGHGAAPEVEALQQQLQAALQRATEAEARVEGLSVATTAPPEAAGVRLLRTTCLATPRPAAVVCTLRRASPRGGAMPVYLRVLVMGWHPRWSAACLLLCRPPPSLAVAEETTASRVLSGIVHWHGP